MSLTDVSVVQIKEVSGQLREQQRGRADVGER